MAQIYPRYNSRGKFKSDDLTKEYIWEKNNLLMLNNKRFMHGRKKYAKSQKEKFKFTKS